MNYKSLNVDIRNKVAHIQLSRPESFNSQNADFWGEFSHVLQEINDQASARVILISSTGTHFSAGMDLAFFGDVLGNQDVSGRYGEKLRRMVLELQGIISLLEQIRMPVLVAIQGGCIGGAVDLVTACDSRYCTNDAYFCVKETDIGMAADLGTLQRLPKVMSQGLARELVYTARKMHAKEAMVSGLVNRVFENQDSMIEGVLDIAEQIASKSPLAVTGCKEMLNYARDHSVVDSLNHIATWQAGMFQGSDILKSFSAQSKREIPEYEEIYAIEPLIKIENTTPDEGCETRDGED